MIGHLSKIIGRLQTVLKKHLQSCFNRMGRRTEMNSLKAASQVHIDELMLSFERLRDFNAALCIRYAQATPMPEVESARSAAEFLVKIATETLERDNRLKRGG